MPRIPSSISPKKPAISKRLATLSTNYSLRQLAFDNAAQANIITIASTGKILIANTAACKLLGYSRKELLTKSRSGIFDINDSNFKEMLKQRTVEGQSIASVTAIKKNGRLIPCEITSSVFMDEEGIENAITTISDMRRNILKQKNIDIKKEKIVADNIILAQSKQNRINTKKEKIIAGNIMLAQAKSDARLEKNNEWIKYIAKASYDVMLDWNLVTGEIYVGESIREVFGYKIQNNTMNVKAFYECLLSPEKKKVKEKLLKTLASGKKSWNDAYMFKRYDGSVASTITRASIVRDESGEAIRLIGAIQDISSVVELEKKLEEQIALLKVNVKEEKVMAADNIIWAKSEQKKIDTKKEKIVADNIILAQSKSDDRLEENNKEHIEHFNMATRLTFDGIWDWNILTNEFFLGEGFEELFGYAYNNTSNISYNWGNFLHPDDKEMVEKGLQEAIASSATYWEDSCRFIRADGFIANVFGRASIVRDANGKACRMIGAIHDLSRQKELEEKLEQEISLKEKQITEAMEDAKDTERSDIGKELHDNINQLLAASKMYLEMAKLEGGKRELYLSRSSEYTMTAIEEIRKLTKGLTSDSLQGLGLCESINNMIRDTMEINPIKIFCKLEKFMENSVNNKFRLAVFRIIQEQVNNILKHAKATKIIITLSQNKIAVKLVISDNGKGFNTETIQKGIGIANIKSRAVSYNGSADFVSEPGQGCVLTVKFPVTDMLLNKN